MYTENRNSFSSKKHMTRNSRSCLHGSGFLRNRQCTSTRCRWQVHYHVYYGAWRVKTIAGSFLLRHALLLRKSSIMVHDSLPVYGRIRCTNKLHNQNASNSTLLHALLWNGCSSTWVGTGYFAQRRSSFQQQTMARCLLYCRIRRKISGQIAYIILTNSAFSFTC